MSNKKYRSDNRKPLKIKMFKSKINYTLSIPITFFSFLSVLKHVHADFFFQTIDCLSKTAIDWQSQYLSPELTNKHFSCHYWADSRRWRSLFPFRKRSLPFLTVDAIIGNQAFCHGRCNICSGLSHNKVTNAFLNSLRKNKV